MNRKEENIYERRRIAMSWWNGMKPHERDKVAATYHPLRNQSSLTGREIENIYNAL